MALQDILAEIAVNLRLDSAEYSAGVARAEATTSRLEKRLNTFSSKASKVGSALAGIGGGLAGGFAAGFTVDAIVRGIDAALQYAGSLGEVSQQLGVTTKDLQTFRYAAGQVGVSQEALETGLGKLTITLGQLRAGAEKPAKALNALQKGLADQVKAAPTTGDALRLIADGFEKIPDRAQRAAVETVLMGKSGAKLDNLLSGGSAALNELARAAEELGIVLSDEQIRRADDTADKLEALKTVLSARIAGVVSDNAGAILELANAFAKLAGEISYTIAQLKAFAANFDAKVYEGLGMTADAAKARGRNFESDRTPSLAGRSVTIGLGPAKRPEPTPTGNDIGNFLAGGGRKGGGGKDRSAEEAQRKRIDALRDQFDFDQQILQAQQGLLQAQQDVAHDVVDRTGLGHQLLDLDRKSLEAQLALEVKLHEITKGAEGISQAQADQLLAWDASTLLLKRQALNEREAEERQQEFQQIDAAAFEAKRSLLEAQSGLARTAAERRAIELRLVDLAFQEERERLERIMRESKDWAAIESARHQLAVLPQQQDLARQGVTQSTRGPRESYLAELPRSLGEVDERLQEIEARGLTSLKDDLAASAAAALGLEGTLGNIATDLLRLGLDVLESKLRGNFGAEAAGGAGQGAQMAASGAQLAAAGGTLNAASAGLNAAGGTLAAAGTTLTSAGGVMVGAAAPLSGAGIGLTAASTQLTTSAAMWSVTAAQITAAATLLMAANAASSATGGIPLAGARASGGPVFGGKAYLVGERGPEIFMPSGGGRIVSNDNSRRMMPGGSTQIFNFPNSDFDSFRRNQTQVARASRRRLGVNQ